MYALPNAEKVLKDILQDELGVPVYVIPPKDAQGPYVRVSRVGGTVMNLVTDEPFMAVSGYSRDVFEASELANRAREVLLGCAGRFYGGVWVRRWRESAGPSNFPDPDSRLFRYQFSGVISLATNN